MNESNALFMARRVMQRNLERAQDALSVYDNDLLRSIMLETAAWLKDFGEDSDPGMTMNEIRAKYFPNMSDEDWEKRYEPVTTIAGIK